jgi:hypothetical protein
MSTVSRKPRTSNKAEILQSDIELNGHNNTNISSAKSTDNKVVDTMMDIGVSTMNGKHKLKKTKSCFMSGQTLHDSNDIVCITDFRLSGASEDREDEIGKYKPIISHFSVFDANGMNRIKFGSSVNLWKKNSKESHVLKPNEKVLITTKEKFSSSTKTLIQIITNKNLERFGINVQTKIIQLTDVPQSLEFFVVNELPLDQELNLNSEVAEIIFYA